MAEVLNAWGHAYRIRDILKVEIQLGVISSQEGLVNVPPVSDRRLLRRCRRGPRPDRKCFVSSV